MCMIKSFKVYSFLVLREVLELVARLRIDFAKCKTDFGL